MRPSPSRASGAKRLVASLAATVAALAVFVATTSAQPDTLASKRGEAERVLAEVNRLDSRLGNAVDAYDGANYRLGQLRRALIANGRDLRLAHRNLRRAQRALAARLVTIYISGEQDAGIEILLGSSSLDDVLARLDAVRRISAQDGEIVREVTSFRARVRRREHELRRARAEQVKVVAERAAERATVVRQLSERRRLLVSVQAEVARIQAADRLRQLALAREVRTRLAARPPAQASGSAASAPALIGASGSPEGAGVAPPERYGAVVAIALRYLGVPYVWGGASPSGFDCSGLTMYVYAQVGVSLPHYTVAQWNMGTPVARDDLQPGDLVFFDGLGHEGIYIGNNQFIHAPHTGDVVKISSLTGWYAQTYVGARRL